MKNSLLALCALLALLCFAPSASAYPYDLYAKYQPKGGGTEIKVRIGTTGELIAGNPTEANTFQGIFLEPKVGDELAKMELERLERLIVDVYVGTSTTPYSHLLIERDALKAGTEKLIFEPLVFGKDVRAGEVRVEVRPKFTAAFLCQEEQTLRDETKKTATLEAMPPAATLSTAKAGKPAAKAVAGAKADLGQGILEASNLAVLVGKAEIADEREKILNAYTTLFSRALFNKRGTPIVYSFCGPVYERIDWKAVASIGATERVTDDPSADAAHARHKDWLATKIVDRLNSTGAASNVRLERHDGDVLPNVYAFLVHKFTILVDTSDLRLEEIGSGEHHSLPGVVDDGSKIILSAGRGLHFCSQIVNCNKFIGSRLKVEVTYEGKDKKDVSVASELKATLEGWIVMSDLGKYLGQTLTFNLYYSADDGARIDLMGSSYTAQVEALGLVTTAPVVSDIAAAAKASKPEGLQLQSSVPVSWAINLSQGEVAHAAITFPWMIGFNTRAAPKLADYIKIFPAASVIFPLEGDTKVKTTRLAFGGGIALANAFTFSAAATVQNTPQAFFLIGVSVPDLVKLP